MKGNRSVILAFAVTFLVAAAGLAGTDLLTRIKAPEVKDLKNMLIEAGELADEGVLDLDLVIDLMSHDNERIRQTSAVVLGEVGDPATVEILTDTLIDPVPVVILVAAEALGKIRDGRAVEPLLRALEDEEPGSEVHCAIICSLAEIGDETARSELRRIAEAGHQLSRHCRTEHAELLFKEISS